MRVWIVITAVVSLGGCRAEPETPDVPRPPRPKIELEAAPTFRAATSSDRRRAAPRTLECLPAGAASSSPLRQRKR